MWINHLLKSNKRCAFVGTKNQMIIAKMLNDNFEYLYPMFTNHPICVVLQSSVCHIGGWNCPKFMHKSKYAYILVKLKEIGIYLQIL